MQMIGTVFSVFLLLLVGYGLKKLKILRADDASVLNNAVLYVFLPALIFSVLYNYKQNFSFSLAKVPMVGFAIIALVLIASYAIGKALKLKGTNLAAFMLAAGFGNTGFLGYPVTHAAFKDPVAMVTAVLYDEFAMALPLYIIGILVVSVFAGEKAHHSHVTHALKMPQLWAIPIAFLARQFHIPQPIANAIQLLGNGTVPVVMISLGLMLSARSMKGCGIPIAIVCVLKLAVLPMMTYFAARYWGITGTVHQTTVLEAGMPTAMLVGVLTAKFGENGEFAAGAVFVTTMLSLFTIPLMLILLGVPGR